MTLEEMNMFMMRTVLATMLLVALATGCDRMRDTPKPVSASEQGKQAQNKEAQQSVALPPSSLPPSDASIKPAAPDATSSSGQSSGQQTQATPKGLEKEQQSKAMPMPGQANNYSTTESSDRQAADQKTQSGDKPKQ